MAVKDRSRCRNIVIAERVGGGHRWMYVGVLQRHLDIAGVDKTIFTSRAAVSQPEVSEHLGPGDRPTILPGRLGLFYLGLLWRAKRLNAESVVIPDADLYLPLVLLTPKSLRKRLRLLIMRLPESPPRNFKQRLKVRILSRLRESNVALFSLTLDPEAAKVDPALVPEPDELSPTRDPEIASLFDPSRYWFGIFGTISRRKNADLALSALIQSSLKDTGLVLAGRLDEDVRVQIDQLREQAELAGVSLVVLDRFLSDSELDTAISAANCVVIAHSNEASSGILVKARKAGTPIIGAGATSLRAPIVNASLGYWCECTEAAIQSAMKQIVTFDVPPRVVDTSSAREFATRLSGVA